MSKQAWRFVLKKEQKHERNRERERERRQRGEKRKLGAQHKNRLAMRHKKTTKTMPITTYNKDSGKHFPPPLSPDTQKQ